MRLDPSFAGELNGQLLHSPLLPPLILPLNKSCLTHSIHREDYADCMAHTRVFSLKTNLSEIRKTIPIEPTD